MTLTETQSIQDLGWVEELDLSNVVESLTASEPRWPQHVAQEVSLEFRRLLIMQRRAPGAQLTVGPLLETFIAEAKDLIGDRVSLLATTARDTEEFTSEVYRSTFGRSLPDTWMTRDMNAYLGASHPAVVGGSRAVGPAN